MGPPQSYIVIDFYWGDGYDCNWFTFEGSPKGKMEAQAKFNELVSDESYEEDEGATYLIQISWDGNNILMESR